MANKKHVALLKQGVERWNAWREEHPEIRPDLYNADLRGANLGGADLHGADLRIADLSSADLRSANLRDAYLNEARLGRTDLRSANLTDANLFNADLSNAKLDGADLRKASVWHTHFADVDLREVKGLAELHHQGASYIELQTIQLPNDDSAIRFLRNACVRMEWIREYLEHMNYRIYHSVFISYSSKDELLARRLYVDLQDRGARCWFAPHDLPIGAKTRKTIDEAIHEQDKLLLILSAASVASDWVEHEVETALAKESKEKRTVLFPIRIDQAILDQAAYGWPELVRNQRNIGDFCLWTEPDEYQRAFDRLLRDLKKADEHG